MAPNDDKPYIEPHTQKDGSTPPENKTPTMDKILK